jgi:HEPN superfamily AbiU2-like protein
MPTKPWPNSARELFDWLQVELVQLCRSWATYQGIFPADDDDVPELLAFVDVDAFNAIERSLRASIIMGFGRMLDPADSGFDKKHQIQRRNVSLAALLSALSNCCTADEMKSFEDQAKAIGNDCAGIEKWRIRHIAHQDMASLWGQHPDPLKHPARVEIDKAGAGVADFLNSIALMFGQSPTHYTAAPRPGPGAKLLFWLKKAVSGEDA